MWDFLQKELSYYSKRGMCVLDEQLFVSFSFFLFSKRETCLHFKCARDKFALSDTPSLASPVSSSTCIWPSLTCVHSVSHQPQQRQDVQWFSCVSSIVSLCMTFKWPSFLLIVCLTAYFWLKNCILEFYLVSCIRILSSVLLLKLREIHPCVNCRGHL